MDVKFINPFLQGTMEVLKTMAFIEPRPGKVYLKETTVAYGDVSGVIGITGDAIGSLALSFKESCIINIVSKMLGETYPGANQEVFDAVGELTNMISGVARNYLEKDHMHVYAAIPSVVYGKDHTINHILNSPSIVIPFMTETGSFVVDVCIKKTDASERKKHNYHVINQKTAVMAPKTVQQQAPSTQPPTAADPPASVAPPATNEAKIEILRKRLAEFSEVRKSMAQQLEEQPFMEVQKRKQLKKKLPFLDIQIKRLKMDIMALEMLSKISDDEFENPTIAPHYQHYDNKKNKK